MQIMIPRQLTSMAVLYRVCPQVPSAEYLPPLRPPPQPATHGFGVGRRVGSILPSG